MSKTSKTAITIIIIVVVGWIVWGNTGNQPSRPATSTPEQTDFTNTFSGDLPFRFSYPEKENISVSTEAGNAKVQILGEKNRPHTEITDGLNGYINTKTISRDLQTTARQVFAETKEGSEGVIRELSSGEFAGRPGYSFQVRTQLNSTSTHYVLPGTNKQALHVNYTVAGSKSGRYRNTFEKIVGTVQITEQKKATTTPSDTGRNPSYATLCKSAGGNWLEQHSECEGVEKQLCDQYGGTYESRASACRHDPDVELI